MTDSPVEVEAVLGTLKDFQRRTAKYAFERLFKAPDSTKRFLVADEVGLGKTHVAKGVIALAIDHLWGNEQIDIIYICCNQDLAAQNIGRLAVTKGDRFHSSTRLSLLARRPLNGNSSRKGLNFVSLTPGTSFDSERNALGAKSERVLLYRMLTECWSIESKVKAMNVLSGNADAEAFRDRVSAFDSDYRLDAIVLKNFHDGLKAAEHEDLRELFEDLCSRFSRSDKHTSAQDRTDRNRLIGRLRKIMAAASITALSPDLIILDEFQRFKDLLDPNNPSGKLAHELFNFKDHESQARVLLLSATPYKMYTIAAESADENHYQEFLNTVGFLFNADDCKKQLALTLEQFRRELLRSKDMKSSHLFELRDRVQALLRRVMARTERLATTADRNGMLTEIRSGAELEPGDVQAFCQMQSIATQLSVPDIVEYWKSAPYLLNFMDDYQLKKQLVSSLDDPERGPILRQLIAGAPELFLSKSDVTKGKPVAARNARLRKLLQDVTSNGVWKLLWMPPTCAYYPLEGAFAQAALKQFTKRLIFSSWRVVPKLIASLVSYEVDRLAYEAIRKTNPEAAGDFGQPPSPLLRFQRQPDGRLVGMPNFAFLYPSIFLSQNCDPYAVACTLSTEGQEVCLDAIRERIKTIIAAKLGPASEETGSEDESWYWAAPLLLDLQHDRESTLAWLMQDKLATTWTGEYDETLEQDDAPSWLDHLAKLRAFVENPVLGKRPTDLVAVLAQIAMGGSANCALRAFARNVSGEDRFSAIGIRNSAGHVGWEFRLHFNRPHVTRILRGIYSESVYWQAALDYSVDGCLQAVLDEYVHILRPPNEKNIDANDEVFQEMAEAVALALSLRPSNLKVDYFYPKNTTEPIKQEASTARFALPLVEARDEVDQDASRIKKVQAAFNSPFWPFVVASTSIGQEGLDFHSYCHAIVHWNLPSNPVDMEQREGRIQRFKGHAVRKNIVSKFSSELRDPTVEPWQSMFRQAASGELPAKNELVPYWIFVTPNGAQIERHVPTLPLSRDLERLQAIRRTLAVYRMVFGQPRQDDLVQYLTEQNHSAGEEELHQLCLNLNVDLSPPSD